jgi:hypothetical protein
MGQRLAASSTSIVAEHSNNLDSVGNFLRSCYTYRRVQVNKLVGDWVESACTAGALVY